MPAKTKEVGALHEEFAKELRKRLKEGEEQTFAGETRVVPVSAAFLNVVRGFLKDNNIECTEGRTTEEVKSVAEALEEFNEADDGAPTFN
jgi:hypothetical protein